MALWEMSTDRSNISKLVRTTFQAEAIRERGDLQAVLRDHIDVLDPDLYVLTEEFANWDESNRRIDLLCIDRQANLVVVELKRDDAAHAELQAIRYAAMISVMTFDDAVICHAAYRMARGFDGEARDAILDFLEWPEVYEEQFGDKVRIILAASTFEGKKELTTAVIWLNDHQIDIRCVTLEPYRLTDSDGTSRALLDVRQIIPPPEAAEMTIKIAAKANRQREARATGPSNRKFDVRAYGSSGEHLAQSRTLHLVVKAAIEHGDLSAADVNAIRAAHPGEFSALLLGFGGSLSSTAFLAARDAQGSKFKGFFSDEALIHDQAGWTWAFSTEWTAKRFDIFWQDLMKTHPNLDVSIEPSE